MEYGVLDCEDFELTTSHELCHEDGDPKRVLLRVVTKSTGSEGAAQDEPSTCSARDERDDERDSLGCFIQANYYEGTILQ